MPVPAALRSGAGALPEGAAWLRRLPHLVAAAATRWDLRLGRPFTSGSSSWCAPARGPAGEDLVLKISFPHAEAAAEAAVLRAWAGHGAVGLIDSDAADWALLLHRVRPGVTMRATRTPVLRRLVEAAAVLRVLGEAPVPDGLPDLHLVGAAWAVTLVDRADRADRAERTARSRTTGGVRAPGASGALVDPGLVREAVAVLRAPPVARPGVVHGDLNPGNLLRGAGVDGDAGSDGSAGLWVAIDPKAMRGDPAYDLWPLLEQVGDPWRTVDPEATLRVRTSLLAG
ncbi:MAG TPA: aminoglycoside phosphotransferase family protein, partial [Cellulomonas sp.]